MHLTQIEGDQVTMVHLCGKCAAERGIDTESEVAQTPLGAFLAAMGKGGAPLAAAAATSADTCPECNATLQDFRASGRVGCPTCWTVFERPLRDLLRRLQGATRHTGEHYVDPGTPTDPEEVSARERASVRERLRVSVEMEQFELAAELRDQLRRMEQ